MVSGPVLKLKRQDTTMSTIEEEWSPAELLIESDYFVTLLIAHWFSASRRPYSKVSP